MPKGTLTNGQEKLGAFVPNEQLSLYNDEWCSSVSTLCSEDVGHDNETGQMGFSSKSKFGPLKCFNPAKSWQLGWYTEQSKRINPLVDVPFSTFMTGITRDISDDNKRIQEYLDPQVPNGGTDLYIGYNLASGWI